MNTQLKKEFDYYLAHQDELVQQFEGRYAVIKDGKILGVYDSEMRALGETRKAHALGTFLIQRVSKGKRDYSQTFHSGVVFR